MTLCQTRHSQRFTVRFSQLAGSRSQEPGPSTDVATYASLLRDCDTFKSLCYGMCIHHRLVKDGLDRILPLSNALLQMYGRCSSLDMASALFANIAAKDHHSWNHMIRAYTRQNQAKDASLAFRRMQEEGVTPNTYIYSSLLSVALGEVGVIEGMQMHARVASSANMDDVYVGTALVGMYGKCGLLGDAESVFSQIQNHDVTLWNTMIALYIQHDRAEDALRLFYEMSNEGTFPTDVTYLSILNACHTPSAVKHIHLNMLFHECRENAMVGTAFLNIYGKLGLLDKAFRVFVDINKKDTVCWNAIAAVYAQNGECAIAMKLFHTMCQEASIWDKCSFCVALSSCSDNEALAEGRRIHASLCALGYESEMVLSNALVNMYGKCGDMRNSWTIFCNSHDRDVVSWNVIIGASSQSNSRREMSSLQLFEQMIQEGVLPDNITLANIVETCSKQAANKRTVEGLHAMVFAVGLHCDTAVGNALVNAYGSWGQMKGARDLVDQMPKKDRVTYINFLLACASKGLCKEGQNMHAEVVSAGLDSNLPVATALIAMYGKASCIEDAWLIFTIQTERDVVLWTAMISAFLYNEHAKEALCLFERMQQKGLKADKVTITSILDACADDVALAAGRAMHDYAIIQAFASDLLVGTALLNMYGRCGMLQDARRVFRDLRERDIVTWTVIVVVNAQHGHVQEAQKLLDQMREEGIEPNEVTFIGILNACSHSGSVDEGRQWFRSMKSRYGLVPTVDHYNCMIDLLARAGLMDEAEALVAEMPMTPTSTTWTTLLGACRVQSDTDRGNLAAENALELSPDRASSYVTLSNLYSVEDRESGAGVG